MKVTDLGQQCIDSMETFSSAGLPMKDASICIVTPKGWKAPPRFPRGWIAQVKENGDRIRYLPAMNVLAWLEAHGLVKVDSREKASA